MSKKIKPKIERLAYRNYLILWNKKTKDYILACLEYMYPEIDEHFKTIKEAKDFIKTQPYAI